MPRDITIPDNWPPRGLSTSPVTAEVVAAAVQADPAVVRDVLDVQERIVDDLLRADGVFVADPVYLSLDDADPLVDFLMRTDYVFDKELQADDDSPLHDEFESLMDGRELATRRIMAEAVVDWLQEAASRSAPTTDGAYDIISAYWHLVAAAAEHGYTDEVRRIPRGALEVDYEDWLVEHLRCLSEHGFDLELLGDERGRGRQRRLSSGRRPDLVCRSDEGKVVVVELKAGHGRVEHVEQLRGYLDEVAADLGVDSNEVFGLLIADGTTHDVRALVDGDDRLDYLIWRQLEGFCDLLDSRLDP